MLVFCFSEVGVPHDVLAEKHEKSLRSVTIQDYVKNRSWSFHVD